MLAIHQLPTSGCNFERAMNVRWRARFSSHDRTYCKDLVASGGMLGFTRLPLSQISVRIAQQVNLERLSPHSFSGSPGQRAAVMDDGDLQMRVSDVVSGQEAAENSTRLGRASSVQSGSLHAPQAADEPKRPSSSVAVAAEPAPVATLAPQGAEVGRALPPQFFLWSHT